MSYLLTPEKINWRKIKVVIFDVDGTLYDQSKLRRKMLYALLSYYTLRPWRLNEMLLLHHFRSEREKNSNIQSDDLENDQYLWCADKGNYDLAKVKRVVDQWIFEFPNKYLPDCVYPGTQSFFKMLSRYKKRIAIYSDYKSQKKLDAMNLTAESVVSSTDPHINKLKPDPKALLYIMQEMDVTADECLFIGDRHDLDGECASKAKIPYVIIEKKPIDGFNFYETLKNQLIATFKEEVYEHNHAF